MTISKEELKENDFEPEGYTLHAMYQGEDDIYLIRTPDNKYIVQVECFTAAGLHEPIFAETYQDGLDHFDNLIEWSETREDINHGTTKWFVERQE